MPCRRRGRKHDRQTRPGRSTPPRRRVHAATVPGELQACGQAADSGGGQPSGGADPGAGVRPGANANAPFGPHRNQVARCIWACGVLGLRSEAADLLSRLAQRFVGAQGMDRHHRRGVTDVGSVLLAVQGFALLRQWPETATSVACNRLKQYRLHSAHLPHVAHLLWALVARVPFFLGAVPASDQRLLRTGCRGADQRLATGGRWDWPTGCRPAPGMGHTQRPRLWPVASADTLWRCDPQGAVFVCYSLAVLRPGPADLAVTAPPKTAPGRVRDGEGRRSPRRATTHRLGVPRLVVRMRRPHPDQIPARDLATPDLMECAAKSVLSAFDRGGCAGPHPHGSECSLQPQAVVMMLWSFATLGYRHDPLFRPCQMGMIAAHAAVACGPHVPVGCASERALARCPSLRWSGPTVRWGTPKGRYCHGCQRRR